jgi:hypothetical protein
MYMHHEYLKVKFLLNSVLEITFYHSAFEKSICSLQYPMSCNNKVTRIYSVSGTMTSSKIM